MPATLKWIIRIVGALVLLFLGAYLLIVLTFSALLSGPSRDEVARVVSPVGTIDAVLIETNGGATTSFGHEVYVVEHGGQPTGSPAVSLYGALRNANASGSNLKWESANALAVEFLKARSAQINQPSQSLGTQTIHFILRPGITDTTAPSGGMLYNRQAPR